MSKTDKLTDKFKALPVNLGNIPFAETAHIFA